MCARRLGDRTGGGAGTADRRLGPDHRAGWWWRRR
jgi:hypothetical protein